jgi:SAC3/GANP family
MHTYLTIAHNTHTRTHVRQLGNGGEVTKYLQQVKADVLSSPQVQFALKVWSALKTENFAKFFRLLRSADLLQACLIHRYVGEVRLTAMKKMTRGFFKGGGGESYYPLSDLVKNLMFEGSDDALRFLDHCGFELSPPDEITEGPCVLLSNQTITDLLPTDKNGNPIAPSVGPMTVGIEGKWTQSKWSIAEICRGKASNGTLFTPSSGLLAQHHTQPPENYEKKIPSLKNPAPAKNLFNLNSDEKPIGQPLNSIPEHSWGGGLGSVPRSGLGSVGGQTGGTGVGTFSQQMHLQPSKKFLPKSALVAPVAAFSFPVPPGGKGLNIPLGSGT